jgi:hypothetical protein
MILRHRACRIPDIDLGFLLNIFNATVRISNTPLSTFQTTGITLDETEAVLNVFGVLIGSGNVLILKYRKYGKVFITGKGRFKHAETDRPGRAL